MGYGEFRGYLASDLPEFLVADPKSGKDPSKEKQLQRRAHDHWCHTCDAYRSMRRDSRRWVRHQAKAALLRGNWDDTDLLLSREIGLGPVVRA